MWSSKPHLVLQSRAVTMSASKDRRVPELEVGPVGRTAASLSPARCSTLVLTALLHMPVSCRTRRKETIRLVVADHIGMFAAQRPLPFP